MLAETLIMQNAQPTDSNKKSLLVEILTEEVPALTQVRVAENISQIIYEQFLKEELIIEKQQIEYFVSNRRMSFFIKNLSPFYSTNATFKIGPKINSNQSAIDGFLKANSLTNISQLAIATQNKQEFYSVNIPSKTISTKDAIAKALSSIFAKSVALWPKTMIWQDESGNNWQWIRPVRNICILLDKEIIDFKYFGLTANNLSNALNRQKIIINSSCEYFKNLESHEVIADHKKRKQIIANQLSQITTENNLIAIDNEDSLLLNEVVGMCENPNALIAEIPQEFLNLPEELLVKTLRNNQRYFCLKDQNNKLSAKFIFINDISNLALSIPANCNRITRDHQKLVRARLNDAMFFINEDLKTPLSHRYENLKNIVFNQKIGSVFEKTTRIYQIAKFIAFFIPSSNLHNLKIACELCKNDLGTKMVAEMPELQGKIGGFYATKEGYEEEISLAISEHYLPISANDSELPKTAIGTTISIADKIDSIVSFFVIGDKPTSSKDPFALRRMALAIIKICLDQKLKLPFNNLITKAINLHLKTLKEQSKLQNQNLITIKTALHAEILMFFSERLKFYLKDQLKYRVELVNVIINSQFKDSDKQTLEINKIFSKIDFINTALQDEKLKQIFIIAKRIGNILQSQPTEFLSINKISRFLITNNAEKSIYIKIKQEKKRYNKAIKDQDFLTITEILLLFVEDLENFFENVLINDENEKLRQNHIQILLHFQQMIIDFIDYRQIEI